MCVCVNFHTHVIVVLVWLLLHHHVLHVHVDNACCCTRNFKNLHLPFHYVKDCYHRHTGISGSCLETW